MTALEAVIADLHWTSPDIVLHGGDLAANGAHPAEVVDRIRELGWPGVCGNTDEMLWHPESLSTVATRFPKLQGIAKTFEEMVPTTCTLLGGERLGWLESLPRKHCQDRVAIVHASPSDLWRAPLAHATNAEFQSTYGDLGASIAVYGHIHHPHLRQLRSLTVANTGSVSLSYDGDPRASYLLVDGSSVTIRRVEYDVERETSALLRCGLPHAVWLCHILRSGCYQPPT